MPYIYICHQYYFLTFLGISFNSQTPFWRPSDQTTLQPCRCFWAWQKPPQYARRVVPFCSIYNIVRKPLAKHSGCRVTSTWGGAPCQWFVNTPTCTTASAGDTEKTSGYLSVENLGKQLDNQKQLASKIHCCLSRHTETPCPWEDETSACGSVFRCTTSRSEPPHA